MNVVAPSTSLSTTNLADVAILLESFIENDTEVVSTEMYAFVDLVNEETGETETRTILF